MWIFESERIGYRLMTLDDTEKVLGWRNSETVRKQFLYQDYITPEIHENYYKTCIEPGKSIQFVMSEKSSGKEFGCVYLSKIDRDRRSAEEGIFIGDEAFQANGYGSEALCSMKEYGFEILDLCRIDVRVRRSNIASIKGCQKAGFIDNSDLLKKYISDGGREDIVFLTATKDGEV